MMSLLIYTHTHFYMHIHIHIERAKSTKYSSVLGMSNIDFTPAEMTAIGVLPSSVRSEDISIAAKT